MSHEEYREMLSSHALSALDAPEANALEAHLATCQSCRSELDKWRSTAAGLAFVGGAMEPSPQLRDRILIQVRNELAGKIQASHDSARQSERAKIVPFEPQRRNVWTSIGSLGAIAAAILFLALIASIIVLWRQNRAARTELARLSTELRRAEAQIQKEQEAIALLSTPGARMTELVGTKMAPGAHAMIAYDKSGNAMLVAKGLPVVPPGKAYQLWFIVGNHKMPGKVFALDETGRGDLKDQIPSAALAGAVFAVTLEPAGGVVAPTGEIFLVSGS